MTVETHRFPAPKSGSRRRCLPLALLASGCDLVVMSPSGDVAVQQRDLVLISTGLMLLIIVPVIALTLFFAFRYRAVEQGAPSTSPTGITRSGSSC